MKRPGISVGWLMFGVAMACVPLGVLHATFNGHGLFGKQTVFDLGLWPTIVGFGTVTFSMIRNPAGRSPFHWAFVVVGWASVILFVVACLTLSTETLNVPGAYYANEIDPLIFDSEDYNVYGLSLLLYGLLLAIPQLLLALGAGLIARKAWGPRWTST